MERVEERPRGLALVLGVLDVAHVCADHDLDSRAAGSVGVGFGEGDAGGDVEDGADGDGGFESGGVEVEEARARVGEGGGAGEGEFEGGFEQETAKDHEVVPVAVLRLHDLGAVDGGFGHGGRVGRALERVGLVGVGEAVGPHLVDQGGLGGVGRGLHYVGLSEGLFVFVVGFAAGEQGAFRGAG